VSAFCWDLGLLDPKIERICQLQTRVKNRRNKEYHSEVLRTGPHSPFLIADEGLLSQTESFVGLYTKVNNFGRRNDVSKSRKWSIGLQLLFLFPFFSSTRDEGEDRDWREKMGLEDDCLHFQLLLVYKK